MNGSIVFFGFCKKGYEGFPVRIETDIRNGFPGFDIIGLADKAVSESKERIRAALRNCGFKFPQQRVLVSLSPSTVAKSGSLLDLPIALSILFATSKIVSSLDNPVRIMAAGELSLNGHVLSSAVCLAAVEHAKKKECNLCILPFEKYDGNDFVGVSSLSEAYKIVKNYRENLSHNVNPANEQKFCNGEKAGIFSSVIGMKKEKEILSMAVSGFHSILLFGPPGVGKSLLCSRLVYLMKNISEMYEDEIVKIYAFAGLDVPDFGICRSPGHDGFSLNSFYGKNGVLPGDAALAHRGVLLLDELDKYSPSLLAAVKDSYDLGTTLTFPSRFLMASNMNACACGSLGLSSGLCSCSSARLDRYWSKVGRPLIERFDIRLPIEVQNNLQSFLSEPSLPDSYYLNKIAESISKQKVRYEKFPDISFNGELHFCPDGLAVLEKEMTLLNSLDFGKKLNSRAQIGLVALARTIADYDGRENTEKEDFMKALELQKYGTDGDYFWKVTS